MKVEHILKLISYNERYKLVGGKTGKTLYKSWINKNLDKYKDLDVCLEPISTDLDIQHDHINGTVNSVKPVILIYVSGV